MSLFGSLAAKAGLRERRAGLRVPTRGIEAYFPSSGEQKRARIKDISHSGICLATEDALPLGSKIEVVLRRKSTEEAEYGTRVSMPAQVARVGRHEVALQFVLDHIDAAEWSKLVVRVAQLSERNDGVRLFRIAKAIAFLQRISPSAEAMFVEAMTGSLSYDGIERSLEILLLAEDLLLSQNRTPQKQLDAKLVRLIVNKGVNLDTFETDMAHLWAWLLATSTLESADETESVNFAELLSGVDLVAARILAAACEKAMRLGWHPGFVFRRKLEYSEDEVKRITGAKTIRALDVGISTLHELGLLRSAKAMPAFQPVEAIDLTPTDLGVRLYARCTGRLEVPDSHAAGGSASLIATPGD